MKSLFIYIQNRLKAVQSVKWVDLDKGQAASYDTRPPIDFPACLIGISLPQTVNHQKKLQKCNVQITVRVVFDFVDHTDSTMPQQALDEALKYFDTIKAVHDSLQGQIDTDVFNAPLERVSQREQNRPDGLKVIDLIYQTWMHEETV